MCDFVGTNDVLCRTVPAYVEHDILLFGDSSYEMIEARQGDTDPARGHDTIVVAAEMVKFV